jgi:sialidase-1
MMKIIFQIAFFSLLAVNSLGCIKNTANLPNSSVQAVTTSPSFPIIKGLSANPVVRLAITIPDDNPEQQFKAIKGTINAAAINSIQQIDLHLTGAQPFVAGTPLVTIQPAANFEAKFDRKFTPGVYFIWFSIVLKADAGIDGKIELNCTELINAAGKSIAVTKDETDHAKRIGVAVRKAGDNEVHTYRIPGLITTDQGTMIAVYDNRYTGTGDLPGNIDVGMSRSIDGGKTWEPMKVIMDMGTPHANNGVGDPAILFDPIAKRLWVAALWSKGNRSIAGSLPGLSPDTTGQFVVVSSEDDGRTWTTPKSITPQIKDPKWHIFFNGPGSGITMQDGKLVFAAQYWDDAKMPYSTIIYSEDRGATWKGNILGPKSNTTESQVVETTPGKLMLNMRDNRGRYRSVATTTNMGATWTEHGTSYSVLPDPVCMGSFIKANVNVGSTAKDILFFSNPNTSSGRYNMTIKASADLGETWPKINQLLIDERQCYGYSSLTRIDANTVGLLYEGTRDLYFVKVPVAELIK